MTRRSWRDAFLATAPYLAAGSKRKLFYSYDGSNESSHVFPLPSTSASLTRFAQVIRTRSRVPYVRMHRTFNRSFVTPGLLLMHVRSRSRHSRRGFSYGNKTYGAGCAPNQSLPSCKFICNEA